MRGGTESLDEAALRAEKGSAPPRCGLAERPRDMARSSLGSDLELVALAWLRGRISPRMLVLDKHLEVFFLPERIASPRCER